MDAPDGKKGAPFVLPPVHKDLQLTPNQIQVLLQMRILPYSVRIKRTATPAPSQRTGIPDGYRPALRRSSKTGTSAAEKETSG